MKNRIKAAGYGELREEMRRLAGDVRSPNGFETVMEFPDVVGRGWMKVFRLRDGLDITAVDCELREGLVMEVAPFPSHVELNFCFSGGGYGRVEGAKAEMGVGAGQSALFFSPDCGSGSAEYPARTRISALEIGLSPGFVGEFLDEGHGKEVGDPPLSARDSGVHCFLTGKTGFPARLALRDILECPLAGSARRVYLEAKALELLALQLDYFSEAPSKNGEAPRLRPDDAERVKVAADALVRDMLDPPSLLDLARSVGLNDFKLKVGFKEVFGTTAFGHLHEKRMERARLMLEEGEMSVGEISRAVGFKDHSSFSAAFKKRFGVKPGSLRRELSTANLRRAMAG